jgi:hypothetical protein
MTEIDEEFDNWLTMEDENEVWTIRGGARKTYLQLRGIWHECFLDALERMSNGVTGIKDGVDLFERARAEQAAAMQKRESEGGESAEIWDGLSSVEYMNKDWLKTFLSDTKDEVSLPVFQEVLEKADVTLPSEVVEALWFNGDSQCKHSSLRKVSDLEDRVAMYFDPGL